MKKILGILAILLLVTGLATARDYSFLGIPESVTVTSTDMALGSYTKLLDSDLSCETFFIHNIDATQQVTVTYNATNPYDDYFIIQPNSKIERNGNTPDGVYCGVTDTTGPVNVSVQYESWK